MDVRVRRGFGRSGVLGLLGLEGVGDGLEGGVGRWLRMRG